MTTLDYAYPVFGLFCEMTLLRTFGLLTNESGRAPLSAIIKNFQEAYVRSNSLIEYLTETNK